jgi:hypothetical protein
MADERGPQDNAVLRSLRLKAASEQFIIKTTARIEAARQRIERTRNLLQAVVLRRELFRRRHRDRDL